MQDLIRNTRPNIPQSPKNSIALIVTPLIELGNNHAREMQEFGLSSISLSAKTLADASDEGRDLYIEIQRGQWSIIFVSAERLIPREFDHLIRDVHFRESLVLLGIDEAHVLVPLGREFHVAYCQVVSLHKRLPPHAAYLVVTATLAPGKDFTALPDALQLGDQGYHCVRLSSERQNVRTVVSELSRGLNGYAFPDIDFVFQPGVKAVIYCSSIDLGFRVAMYGWQKYPPGSERLNHVRLWNSMTSPSYNSHTLELFQDNSNTLITVATIAFGMGMNIKNITYSINLGLPDTLEALVQQNGRAWRDLQSESCRWTFVESSTINRLFNNKPTAKAPSMAKRNIDDTEDIFVKVFPPVLRHFLEPKVKIFLHQVHFNPFTVFAMNLPTNC